MSPSEASDGSGSHGLLWLLFTRFGTVLLILFLLWQLWGHFGPEKPELTPERQAAAEALFPEIVEDLRTAHGGIGSAAVLHFADDPSDFVTDGLRDQLELAGVFDLQDRTLGEKVFDTFRLRHDEYGTSSAAIEAGADRDVEGVVFGRIERFEMVGEVATLDLSVALAAVKEARVVFEKRYTMEGGGGLGAGAARSASKYPWIQRLLAWAIIVLLLPVFTIAFLRTMVSRRSNATNAFVLGIYTAVAAALAWLMLGAGGFLSTLMLLLCIVAAFFYNVTIMTFALRLEE